MKTKQILFVFLLGLIAAFTAEAHLKITPRAIRKVPTYRPMIVKLKDNYPKRITYWRPMAQSNIPTSQAKVTPAVILSDSINQHNRLISPIETNQSISLPEGNEISTNESNDDYYAGDAICVNDDNDVNDISINWPLLLLFSVIMIFIFLNIIAKKRNFVSNVTCGEQTSYHQLSCSDKSSHYIILANGGGVLILD